MSFWFPNTNKCVYALQSFSHSQQIRNQCIMTCNKLIFDKMGLYQNNMDHCVWLDFLMIDMTDKRAALFTFYSRFNP